MHNRKRPTDDYCVEDNLHSYWIDVESRELWLRGSDESPLQMELAEPGIEYMCATRTNMNLNLLRRENNNPVIFHMQTCGGSYTEGMSIYDTMRAMPYVITIISYTHAQSMSSIILQAGDLRLMLPNSYFMIHRGDIQIGAEYQAAMSQVDRVRDEDIKMMDIYVENMKGSKKFGHMTVSKIRKYLLDIIKNKSDVFLTPQETISWGLADGILQGWENNKVIYD